MASGRTAAAFPGRGLHVGRAVLAAQDEDAAQPGPLRGAHVGSGRRRRPSRSRCGGGSPRRPPGARAAGPAQRRRNPVRRRLAERSVRRHARWRIRARPRTRPHRRRALRGQPPRVAVHADQLGTGPDEPERPVHVVVGQRLGCVADDHGARLGVRRRSPPRGSAAAARRTRVRASTDPRTYSGRTRVRPRPCTPPRRRGAAENRSAGTVDAAGCSLQRARVVPGCTSEVFVTIRYGIRAPASVRSASAAPAIAFPARTMTPSRSRSRARTPCRAARSSVGGRGPSGMMAAYRRTEEGCMGLLDGKTALIFGVANDHSIAWGIARALHAEGAEVGFSSVESLIEKRVRPLATSIGSTFVEPCDVTADDDIERVFGNGARRTTRSTSSSTPWRSRSARTSRARSSTRRATDSRWRWTSPRTRSSRSTARRPAVPQARLVGDDPHLLRRREGRRATTT